MPDVHTQEYPYDFGAITAATVSTFSLYQNGNMRGNANINANARIVYVLLRNNTGNNVVAYGTFGPQTVGNGERKRIELSGGSRFFNVIPAGTVSAGQLTADIGIEGVTP